MQALGIHSGPDYPGRAVLLFRAGARLFPSDLLFCDLGFLNGDCVGNCTRGVYASSAASRLSYVW
ncbi:hypothetical protein M3J09_007222 [Ascochyta lentis]